MGRMQCRMVRNLEVPEHPAHLSFMENEETIATPAPEVAPAPIAQPAPSVDTRDRLDAARQFAEEQYDKLRRATADQMENVRGYTKEARKYAEEQYDKLRHATADQMENVRGYTQEAYRQLNEGWDVTRSKAKDLHHAGEEYVRSNPTGCVLGAVAVGVILGLLLGGRRH